MKYQIYTLLVTLYLLSYNGTCQDQGLKKSYLETDVNPGAVLSEFVIKGEEVNSAYLFEGWNSGNLQLVNGNSFVVNLRYDVLNEVLELNKNNQVLICRPNEFVSFKLLEDDTTKYVSVSHLTPMYKSEFLTGLFEIIYSNKGQILGKHTSAKVKEPDYNPALNVGSRNEEVKYFDNYYWIADGKYRKLEISKSKIPGYFEPYSDQIESYIKKKKLNPKRSIQDLGIIFDYYCQLVE